MVRVGCQVVAPGRFRGQIGDVDDDVPVLVDPASTCA
jgi:hypothetical protein